MGAPDKIIELMNRFHEQYESYRSQTYNEAQLRQEFVDPFFAALEGWVGGAVRLVKRQARAARNAACRGVGHSL